LRLLRRFGPGKRLRIFRANAALRGGFSQRRTVGAQDGKTQILIVLLNRLKPPQNLRARRFIHDAGANPLIYFERGQAVMGHCDGDLFLRVQQRLNLPDLEVGGQLQLRLGIGANDPLLNQERGADHPAQSQHGSQNQRSGPAEVGERWGAGS